MRAGAALLLALSSAPVGAQSTVEVWGGYARGSTEAGWLGDTPGMNFGLVAFRWSRRLGPVDRDARAPYSELSVDLIPIARISRPLTSVRPCLTASTCILPPPPSGDEGLFPAASPFGAGFNILGLTRRFAPLRDISPSLGATFGALLFEERVPTTHASALNFLVGVEAGLRLGPVDRRTVILSYRALHLSNGGTQRENPGVLSHLVSIGVRFPRSSQGQEGSGDR